MNENTPKEPTLRNKIKAIVEKLREKDLVIQASLWEISKSDTLNWFGKLKVAILNSGEDSGCIVNSKKMISCLNTLINHTEYVANDLAKQKIAAVVQELAELVNNNKVA